ncbi:MAG: GyrI-like domain-containing protein, partial [Demequina sp.]
PGWVPGELIEAARGAAAVKIAPGLIDRIRADLIDEGLCAQTLHIGPFADEGPVVEQLHRAVEDAGLEMSGRHHEIYLSDMRRTAPEKLRTILRQPVSRRSTVTSESR